MTSQERLIAIQRYILKMPSLTTTVTKVIEVCNNPATNPYDLNRVISLDPVLTGQVLKLINSAYYSLPNRITSLTRAIIMLGINTVKNLVLATSVLAGFKGSQSIESFPIDEFWAHSLATGVISKALAQHKDVPAGEREMFFVAGLMHDLGKLPMMGCFPDLYHRIIEAACQESCSLCLAEKKIIGLDHNQIGRLIAAKWKFDETMVEAIVDHHKQQDTTAPVVPIRDYIALANGMAYYFNIGSAGEQHLDEAALQQMARRCDIQWSALMDLQAQFQQEIEKAKVFLQT